MVDPRTAFGSGEEDSSRQPQLMTPNLDPRNAAGDPWWYPHSIVPVAAATTKQHFRGTLIETVIETAMSSLIHDSVAAVAIVRRFGVATSMPIEPEVARVPETSHCR